MCVSVSLCVFVLNCACTFFVFDFLSVCVVLLCSVVCMFVCFVCLRLCLFVKVCLRQ